MQCFNAVYINSYKNIKKLEKTGTLCDNKYTGNYENGNLVSEKFILFLGGKNMRAIKKGIAALLCAAMVITLAPAGNAGAAKKPKLNKKNVSVGVGETVKIKVKNAKKKAKVTWKTSKKSVAKITKKVSKGKKASATVMGGK